MTSQFIETTVYKHKIHFFYSLELKEVTKEVHLIIMAMTDSFSHRHFFSGKSMGLVRVTEYEFLIPL